MVTRGTFKESDGSEVEMADAKAAWIPLAREVLLKTAGKYHALISYGELAAELQSQSGIHTKQLVHYWIGDVLGSVARDCHAKDEPLLSALCVQQNGLVGAGYKVVWADTYGEPIPEDLDQSAADERLKCYQFFGADDPGRRRARGTDPAGGDEAAHGAEAGAGGPGPPRLPDLPPHRPRQRSLRHLRVAGRRRQFAGMSFRPAPSAGTK